MSEDEQTDNHPAQCYWCKHPDHGEKVCPVRHLAIGSHDLSGSYPCGCPLSTVINTEVEIQR